MKIAIISGSRADWSPLELLHDKLTRLGHESYVIDLWSVRGVPVDDPEARISEIGHVQQIVGAHMLADRPALAIINGDRFEILAAALACYLCDVPIVHLSGGDRTFGSADDQMRDAISMLSSIHFPTNRAAGTRLMAMGCGFDRIFCYGAPAIDRIKNLNVSRETFLKKHREFAANWSAKNIVVMVHPSTREPQVYRAVLAGCHRVARDDVSFFIARPNTDAGNSAVASAIATFCDHHHAVFFDSLLPDDYLALLALSDCLVGNSSSGIYEAPYLKTPSVDVGSRQNGRPRAGSVWHVLAHEESIALAVDEAIKAKPSLLGERDLFGDGNAAEQIAREIGAIKDPRALLKRDRFER